MDWDEVKGNWKQFTGSAKKRWGQLTDDEVTEARGDREKFEGLIQARYGRTKDQARKEVDTWLSEHEHH